ncbi:Exocyst complex component Sec8 [Aspergillus fumigatus Z5]|nr:Exocyst complex component Sec8 [Aspergillus fumigatus Z5]
MNGRNGYADGYGYPESNRYDRSDGGYGSSNSNLAVNGYSGGRDRRPGGYGGFYNESSQEPSPSASPERRRERWEDDRQNSSSRSRTRDTDSERRPPGSRDGRGRGETSWVASSSVERSGAEGAKPMSSGAGSQAMEDILQAIQRDWGFVASDDCVPVQVALQLMDTSTLGKADREPDFLNMNQQIQKTLKSVVNEHHQGFNSSIGTYHKIQSNIQSSQNRVRNLKHALEDAKAGLLYTKPELKGLATSSQKYDDLIQLLSQIQEIQSLPEKLESRISDKRFLGAVEVLHDAFRLLRRSELENIGALADIRAYFANQEISLTDILIEELHDHLYLKSPYCSNRWKPPAQEGEVGTANASSWTGVATWEKPVYAFLGKLDATTPLVEDASRNPEADTFYYIRLLIEALNKMGHLDIAVDRIEQRLPVELFAVVDKTNAEVDARHPNLGRGLSSRDGKTSLPTEAIEKRGHVLTEFLWTLYAKFEAIAEGHRVLHDAIAGIVEREGIPKNSSLTGGFKELWKLYQSEPWPTIFDTSQKLFKLSETEQNTEMQAEQDELDEILKTSVPGLVSKTRQKFTTTDSSRNGQGNSGTGHKILIEPSVFNMSLLLPPSLSFIQRLKDIVPVDADIALSTLTSFLDDFLVNVFLPQLDETVTDLCSLSFIAPDAFTEDPQWSKSSPRPVFKATIVTKVSPRNHGQVRLKAAAEFAESGDIHDTVRDLWERPEDAKKELIVKEIELLLKRTDEVSLEPYDIISDPKTVVALSLLYNSMQWLASHLAKLRRITASESKQPQPEARATPRRWTLIGAMKSRRDSISQPVYLPLNHEMANAFDTTLQSLRNLASTALFALHIDIRCGVIHMLTRTMTGPNPPSNRDSEPTTPSPNSNLNWWHILVNQPTAASPTILELNNDLIAFDTNISSYLGPAEHWFITSGLARFIDQAFVSSTRHIGAMNENGALRLQLDVLVLQQNLKNIIIDPTADKAQDSTLEEPGNPDKVVALPRSAKFLDWFLDGAEKTLEYAKDEKELFAAQGDKALAAGNGEPLTYDELKVLIDLCFSEILRGPRGAENREDFMAAKKASADALLKLNEIMWDSK